MWTSWQTRRSDTCLDIANVQKGRRKNPSFFLRRDILYLIYFRPLMETSINFGR